MIRTKKFVVACACGLSVGVPLLFVALFGSGCQSMTAPSGFLSTYTNLVKVNGCLWRYVNTNKLATYTSYEVASVKVLVKEYGATPIGAAERQAAAQRFREIIVQKLAGAVTLVDKPSTNTAEIRAAITTAFPNADYVTFGMEAEIIDAYSGEQVAAIRQYESSDPLYTGGGLQAQGVYTSTGLWWDMLSSKYFMQECAGEYKKAIEKSRGQ